MDSTSGQEPDTQAPGSQRKPRGEMTILELIADTIFPEWVTPNGLTWIRLAFVAPTIYAILVGSYWEATWAYALGMTLDMFDGALARARGLVSEVGANLDPLVDKLVDMGTLWTLLFCGAIALSNLTVLPITVMSCCAIILTGARRARAKYRATHPDDDDATSGTTTNWGKWKTATEVTAILFLLGGMALKEELAVSVGIFILWPAALLGIASTIMQVHRNNKLKIYS